ncbi:DUF5366 family protein [Bacillus solimangrovi]|uniref:Uncharacterized protein n=1 Tax=Bacillus solimangrovi TaxID=1305675 RepID=A0A1E5LIT9_9BACI|nr:DUF5366 family protein [Bacillus solimangrovi]OEH94002.1 hypothetical protein BFG57_10170 [Bacillus solimangrovi]
MPGIKNSHYTCYFPLLSIVLLSASFAISTQNKVIDSLQSLGILQALIELFSFNNLRFLLFFGIMLCFFFLLSGLKIIFTTLVQFSCLLFADEKHIEQDRHMEEGRFIYLIGAVLSMVVSQSLLIVCMIFFVTTFVYFVFLVYRMIEHFTLLPLIGFIFANTLSLLIFVLGVGYFTLRIYRLVLESLPI